MRAAVYRSFGGPEVVRVEELPKPVPRAGEVLIRVHASTVSVGDYRMRTRDLPKGLEFFGPLTIGIFAPRKKILGMDFAGVIEAVGEGVTRFKPGDAVVGLTGMKFGGHAEYVTLKQTEAMVLKPEGWSFEDTVALVFGGHTVAECIRQCTIKPGDEVLVNGASGAVGSSAIQVAKHFGAVVTAVTSAGNAELVRSLGADQVIDYKAEDFTRSGKQYDVIFECVGNAPFERVEQVLKPGGTLLLVIIDLKGMLGAGKDSRRSGKRVIPINFKPKPEDVAFEIELAKAGALRPVIDRIYPLEQVVEAHRHVDTGRKRGSVVLQLAG
ncbi:MAG TPA: NAD(P)-dependent alcohol dehydrogenase [Devosia sp.]|jgi:NADPH:quinone reductase-like Zn-dependent oxidoreductase|uniref:NAD(P)-dependent alcohol dehydrogenase n=1 Tax=Devosia sp. TaxID=1871048 RepID=UPI002DDD0BD2|nr:NAD(P)-dependent alcohol dehydrogenase [Devosia sp.]HEV2515563.1 NAD(P)-dependent alcohol dehydrogenase [Devosia sp.]